MKLKISSFDPSRSFIIAAFLACVLAQGCGGNGEAADGDVDADVEASPDQEIDSQPDTDVPGETDGQGDGPCTPLTCQDLGKECGSWDNGCGTDIPCGPCGTGWTCSSDGLCEALPPAGAPVLFFSNLESGPKTGWAGSTAQGAAVTIWGKNFGPSRGSSFVTVGGVDLTDGTDYAEWGGHGPARGLERIVFWLRSECADGPGEITVTVDSVASNAIPFTVRAGSLYLVRTDGDDGAGDGSWASPWRTIVMAKESLAPGDIAYIGDGVTQTVEDGYNACVNLSTSGEEGLPKALVAYPGAAVTVGNAGLERAFHNWATGTGDYSMHWVISGITISGGPNAVPADTGFRIVGNVISAPTGDGPTGAIEGSGDHIRILGNEFHDVGDPDCSKLYHVVYISGVRTQDPPRQPTESDREIAWNDFHDNDANRAVNIYSEQAYSAFIEGHSVHDNLIVNQRGDGILLGYYVTGDNRVYNNVIINAGLGPEWSDDASSHSGIRIDSGHEDAASTAAYVYNNTLYGCGWSGAAFSNGALLVSQEALDRSTELHFAGNIIVSTGDPYVTSDSGDIPSGAWSNLFFGNGAAPSWDTSAVNEDPRFTDAAGDDLHLQTGSPAIDSGAAEAEGTVRTDFDGVPRPQGAGYDIGAYEFMP